MAKHTPGPWFFELHELPLGKGQVISIQSRQKFDPVEEDDDPTLAGIYSLDPVDFANAKVLATAPELLAILEHLVKMYGEGISGVLAQEVMLLGKDWDRAREMIAKARGEQT